MVLGLLKNFGRVVSGPLKFSKQFKKVNNFNNLTNLKKSYSTAAMSDIIFRQLLDYDTFTYTYILGDPNSRQAVIIDPVLENVSRDAQLIKELDLDPIYAINTHVHADHITGSGVLQRDWFAGCSSVLSKQAGLKVAVQAADQQVLKFGSFSLTCLSTPGHTNGCMTFLLEEKGWLFTGDSLLIRRCGRTDFQEGSAQRMYKSVHDKIFCLPDHYLVYPAHDYNGHTVSSVGEEKKFNPRLSKSEDEFISIMDNLKLDKPKYIDIAVPANLKDGLL